MFHMEHIAIQINISIFAMRLKTNQHDNENI